MRSRIPQLSRAKRRVITFAFGASLLALAATWPLVLHLGSSLPGDLGDPLLNAWILGWDAARLRDGFVGLWNAPILFPNTWTLAFSEHLLGQAVPLAPIVWLTNNPVVAYNVWTIATYPLAATGMFLLGRFITGRDDAAMLAALAFAFSPVRAGQLSHIQVMTCGWMPLALWALHRYFATGSLSALAMFVVAFVWQAYSNSYFLYFLALPVAIVVIVELTVRRQGLRGRVARTFAELSGACVAILLALLPVVYAYVEMRRVYGFRRTYRDLFNFSATVESYLHVAAPVRLWRSWLAQDSSSERQLFPGLILLVLASAAVVYGWRRRATPPPGRLPASAYVWCYGAITLAAYLLSLGPEPRAWGRTILPFSPFLTITSIVPGLDGLRVAARLSVVVQLGLSALAAIGAAHGLAWLGAKRPWTLRPAVALLAVAIVAEGWAAPIPAPAFTENSRDRPVYEWLASKPAGAVLELPITRAIAPTLTYQYATLRHHHPIVNGYSGYGSVLQSWLGGPVTPLNELLRMHAVVDALQSLGVRYVIVHRNDYADREFGDQTLQRLRQLGPQIVEVKNAGATTGFMLAPATVAELDAPHGPLRIISPGALTATASHNAAGIGAALDGNPDSRWVSGRGQRGDEWIRIAFRSPTRVRRVQLTMSYATLGEYPRGLIVDAIDASGTSVPRRSGAVLAPLAKGLLADAEYPVIDLSLSDGPPVTALLLRQTELTRNLNWSVHELRLLGP